MRQTESRSSSYNHQCSLEYDRYWFMPIVFFMRIRQNGELQNLNRNRRSRID